MAATNYTPIQLYYSSTASAAPTAGNLTSGELAINITDGKLYYKDNGGVVQVIATKGAGTIGGSTTQIQYNNAGSLAGSASMTFNSGTNVTTLTTLNLTNALGATYGGTAQSAYAQGDVLYASATNTLSKLGIGTVNYILTSTGSVPQWVAPTSITVNTATNLAGGAGGSVPYQSAADTTTFLAIGAANRVMTSSGSAPQWVTALTGLTGVSSSSITDTGLTSGRVTYASTGGLLADSTNLTFNGTTLSAGGFSTTGLSTLVQTVTIGNSNFSGTSVFAPSTPAKLYIGTGTVTDTTSAIGATNTTGAISALAITPIAATNTTVTYTNASTLYIAGAPSAGTNVTITNPYSLYVAAGAAYFGGAVTFAGSASLAGLTVTSLTDSGLTSGRVTFASTGGLLADSANLTWNGSALTVTGSLTATNGATIGNRLTLNGVGTSELYTADASGMYLTAATSGGMYIASDGAIYFRKATTPFTNYMTLTSTGQLLVNTPSALYTNSKIQATASSGPTIGIQQTTANQYAGGFWNTQNTGNLIAFFTGAAGSQIGDITGTTTTLNINGPTTGSGIQLDNTGGVAVRGSDNVDFIWLKLKSGISAGNVKTISWEDTAGTVLAKDSITFSSGIITRNFGSFYNSGATTNNVLSLNNTTATVTGALSIATSATFPTTGFTYNANGYFYTLGGSAGTITQIGSVNRFAINSNGLFGFGSTGASSDRLADMSFAGATTAGANQFGIVLNPTYPTTVTSSLFNIYAGPNLTSGTTVTSVYGLYLEAGNYTGCTVTNKYALYQAGSSDKNYFAGNVGIGITGSTSPLAFADSVAVKMQLNGNNANGYQIGLANSVAGGDAMMKFTAGLTGAGEIGWYNTTNLRMLMDSAGKFLIGGATSAVGRLTVKALSNTYQEGISTINTAGNYWTILSNSANDLYIGYNAGDRGYFANATGVYTPLSDRRSKKNITDIEYGLNAVLALRSVQYHMNEQEDTEKKNIGFIAQEAMEIVPESVSIMMGGMYGMDRTSIVPVLVKAIQEQQAIILSLKARLDAANL